MEFFSIYFGKFRKRTELDQTLCGQKWPARECPCTEFMLSILRLGRTKGLPSRCGAKLDGVKVHASCLARVKKHLQAAKSQQKSPRRDSSPGGQNSWEGARRVKNWAQTWQFSLILTRFDSSWLLLNPMLRAWSEEGPKGTQKDIALFLSPFVFALFVSFLFSLSSPYMISCS